MKKNKRLIVWFHRNLANEITEMCGSDSIEEIDNRLSNESAIRIVTDPYNRHMLYRKNKGAIGFKIAEGTILNHKYITDLKYI